PRLSSPIYKEYHHALIQERDRDLTGDRSYDDGYNLFTCLSRNPWLPGWILTTTLILSVLVLIWICCATVATAVDQYVPAEVSPVRFYCLGFLVMCVNCCLF
ncbi:hypothetical protein ATANTOWER_000802, partial [Ataeniobius toweri]|nr:hypothetical protein [Ataeniobius toweri]